MNNTKTPYHQSHYINQYTPNTRTNYPPPSVPSYPLINCSVCNNAFTSRIAFENHWAKCYQDHNKPVNVQTPPQQQSIPLFSSNNNNFNNNNSIGGNDFMNKHSFNSEERKEEEDDWEHSTQQGQEEIIRKNMVIYTLPNGTVRNSLCKACGSQSVYHTGIKAEGCSKIKNRGIRLSKERVVSVCNNKLASGHSRGAEGSMQLQQLQQQNNVLQITVQSLQQQLDELTEQLGGVTIGNPKKKQKPSSNVTHLKYEQQQQPLYPSL